MPDLKGAVNVDSRDLQKLLSLLGAKVITETEVREYLQIDTKEPVHA